MKQKYWNGNYTFYDKDGAIDNKEFENGKCLDTRKKVIDPKLANFGTGRKYNKGFRI